MDLLCYRTVSAPEPLIREVFDRPGHAGLEQGSQNDSWVSGSIAGPSQLTGSESLVDTRGTIADRHGMQLSYQSRAASVMTLAALKLQRSHSSTLNTAKLASASKKMMMRAEVHDSWRQSNPHGSSVGVMRVSSERDLHRRGGRPLTAKSGVHLISSSTISPSSCLSHISTRIV